ncbi:hypothetical protein Krad_4715 (plasmid) [Kineococcus radiotolerans SRS30216 = ATCC BAA-149]|uniref:Uncharacterized protein n=2 Tax=Kineococcus radiotolerans TaxID=131568 RepID=A6WH84_KINRD|nr:hypothetical protein Krad_4715 [Kineococcus radiotolerans SRS30216 = ATCC BAA-149]
MVQVRAVVGEHGQALTADDLLRTNGAAGDRARAAVARLHALHAELETVRRVHLALFAYLTAGRDREVVPGTAATMTALARARVLWCPGFATAWPAWRRPLVPPGTPEPASPWQGGPVQQLLTLVAHGSWTPTPQQVATAWLDALDAQDGAPAA